MRTATGTRTTVGPWSLGPCTRPQTGPFNALSSDLNGSLSANSYHELQPEPLPPLFPPLPQSTMPPAHGRHWEGGWLSLVQAALAFLPAPHASFQAQLRRYLLQEAFRTP